MSAFRFQDLQIWQEACRLGDILDTLADELEVRRKYRYAEQLRAAALSVSNNIAEGSGSNSDKDFKHFLNIARRSVFENANMVLFLTRKKLLAPDQSNQLLEDHRVLAARIAKFSETI
jgi:four helix bundle protein